MAEGASALIFDGRSFNSVREAVRIFIDFDQRDEEVRLLFHLHNLFSRVVQDPVVGRIGPLLGGPAYLPGVEGGRGGHARVMNEFSLGKEEGS